jgi:hypothetical protein
MPLNWKNVVDKYGEGFEVPTIRGGKTVSITHVDNDAIHIKKGTIWKATLQRANLEKGVELIETGVISRDPGLFVEDYMIYVAHERASSVAHIFRDLGFLDKTETFSIRGC